MQQIGSWAILNCMNTTFAELGLNEQILSGVAELGFEAPTPVQAQTIPQILKGRDMVASAQTGTGETAAFALPTMHASADLPTAKQGKKKTPTPHALIITPT